MRSRSNTFRASTWLAPLRVLGPLCLVAGCSSLHRPHPPPLPFEVTPQGVDAQVLAPVTLDQVDRPAPAAGADRPAAASPSARLPELTRDTPPSQPPLPPGRGREDPGSASEGSDRPPVYSLPEAVAFGRENNPRLQAALADIDKARGQEQVAFAPFLPEIDLLPHAGVTSPRLGPASAAATGIIIPTTSTETHAYAQAEVQLQWTVCDFGRTAGRYGQAGARVHIAELQSTRAEETVGYEVASAYLHVLRAGAVRRIQADAIRRAEATLRDTRSRRAAGVAERDDVLRAEVQLAAAREDLDLAREAELAELARLNHAMGRNASLPLSVVGWKSGPPFGLSLARCLEIAADHRPEVGVAREAAAAAQFGRQAVAAEFRPRVYVLASAGGVGGSNIASGSQEGVGLHMDLPLYSGGRRKGELRAADADVLHAVADARSILDGITLQVTLAYLEAATAYRRIGRDRPAVVEARENLRLVRNRYRNGTATPTDIVDAETALTGAQQRLASATYDYLAALVTLDYALGNPAGHLLGPPDAPEDDGQAPEELPVPRPVRGGVGAGEG